MLEREKREHTEASRGCQKSSIHSIVMWCNVCSINTASLNGMIGGRIKYSIDHVKPHGALSDCNNSSCELLQPKLALRIDDMLLAPHAKPKSQFTAAQIFLHRPCSHPHFLCLCKAKNLSLSLSRSP